MLSAIGTRTAHQLRLAGARSVRHVAVRRVSRSAVVTFRRGFCVTLPRPEAADNVTVKPRKPKSKVEEKAQPAKRALKSTRKQQEKAAEKKKAQEEKALKKKAAAKEKALERKNAAKEKKNAAKEKALEKKKALKEKAKERAKALKVKNAERVAMKERSAKIRSLKATALSKEVPPLYVATIFTTYVKEYGSNGDLKELAERMKGLTEAEREILLAQTAALNETIRVNYETFVRSKTPLEIWEANQARAKLNKLNIRSKPFRFIQDPRLPKGPRNSYVYFARARLQGEFSGQIDGKATLGPTVKQIAEQWRALSDAERQPYLELAERDKERYVHECKTLGIPTGIGEKAE